MSIDNKDDRDNKENKDNKDNIDNKDKKDKKNNIIDCFNSKKGGNKQFYESEDLLKFMILVFRNEKIKCKLKVIISITMKMGLLRKSYQRF